MASTKDRQRQLARAKLDRQLARRAAKARRRLQLRAGLGAAVALVLVIAGTWWLVRILGKDDKKTPPAAATSCFTDAQGASLKDVGKPGEPGPADAGVRPMTITTNQGVVEIQLDGTKAPCNVGALSYLAGKQFYDNTKCHRILTQGSFMLQCGDPTGSGSGGPTFKTKDENLPSGQTPPYPKGTVAMANSGPNTNGSQLFLVYKDSSFNGPNYVVVGKVTKGLDILEKIAAAGAIGEDGKASTTGEGKPKTEVTIQSVTVGAVQPAPTPSPSAPPASPKPSASS